MLQSITSSVHHRNAYCCLILQENFEANSDNGAFEAQYKRLLEEIQQIYESAKEFHGKVSCQSFKLQPVPAFSTRSKLGHTCEERISGTRSTWCDTHAPMLGPPVAALACRRQFGTAWRTICIQSLFWSYIRISSFLFTYINTLTVAVKRQKRQQAAGAKRVANMKVT